MEIKCRFDGKVIFKDDATEIKLTLQAAALRGAYLCGAYLCDADLCGADLGGANLGGANLCGANLCGADLCGANLCDATLCGADLGGANLCGANLCGADLGDANLGGANLCGADLGDAKIKDSVELKAKLSILQCGPVGSRQDYLIIFNTKVGLYVKAGLFSGHAHQICFGSARKTQWYDLRKRVPEHRQDGDGALQDTCEGLSCEKA